jgi:hypothetical protein
MKLRRRATTLFVMVAIAFGLGASAAQAAPAPHMGDTNGHTLCAASLMLNVGICVPYL